MIDKCKYYEGNQTACSLMIDDLVPVAVTTTGVADASNDWGYLMDLPKSLYTYFKENLLNKYPEIKGTFFLPLCSQNYIATDCGFTVLKRNVYSSENVEFLGKLSSRFEMAFHGNIHGSQNSAKHFIAECENLTIDQRHEIVLAVKRFAENTNIRFTGGKFPAYKYNIEALQMINSLGAKWWALQIDMINRKSPHNDLHYDEQLGIVLIPTNLCGDVFKYYDLPVQRGVNALVKRIVHYILQRSSLAPVEYVNYLYNNGLPFIIQEHFQNQRADGGRQTPSIYYDICSLDRIFGFLRGKYVWYATCGEIADYYLAYLKTSIIVTADTFEIKGGGISFKTDFGKAVNTTTGVTYQAMAKGDFWIFKNLSEGKYKIQN